MINQRIGSFIATLRKEQNLTQEQFAQKLGVSNRSVSRWENGNTLPDFSLMQDICQITGITLPELLRGVRDASSGESKNHVLSVLALWEREKTAKITTLNIWFSLGLLVLLAVVLTAGILSRVQAGLLLCLGFFFHGLGFYHNNRDPRLTDAEKAILAVSGGDVSMRQPEELLIFARLSQKLIASQYKTAFREICDKLAEHERVSFAMVANEYSIGNTPGFWHVGIAVTQTRIFLCGETVAGRFMTRTVMDIYNKEDILSIEYTDRHIILKTAQTPLIIRGENLRQLGEYLKKAVLP